MLRILLIILVALAVIIGLMRLTGSKSGDVAPVPAAEPAVEEAIEAAPADEVIVDEPAVDALDAPVAIEGETVDPAAGDPIAEPEAPATDAAPPAPDAAATDAAAAAPVETPAPIVEEPATSPDPDAPGRP